MLSEVGPSQKDKPWMLPFRRCLERLGAGGRGNGEWWLFTGRRVSVLQEEECSGRRGGDGCTTTGMY